MKREVQVIDFCEWVREKRKKKGYAQYTLAEYAGVNPNTLSNYMQGYSAMPLEVAERLCNALGADLVVKEHEE